MGVGNGGAPVQERPRTPDRKRGGLRFHVRELGPVKRAELELGGLTVLAGRNNTGKTWLATALYGFLTRWREHTDAVFREFSDNQALAEAGSFLRHSAEHDYAARAWSGWSLQEERQILLDEAGRVSDIRIAPRYDSHRLIEEFMIAANVAAAGHLEQRDRPCMYRIHEPPAADGLEALRAALHDLGVPLPASGLRPADLNRILKHTAGLPQGRTIHELVLRAQNQAAYSPENCGHFGLALPCYAHFTSPIRRYADLLVHRAIVGGMARSAADGLPAGAEGAMRDWGERISAAERRAMAAERDAADRYMAAFMQDKIGASFGATVSGIARAGLFVTLAGTGASGLVPMSLLPDSRFRRAGRKRRPGGVSEGLAVQIGDTVQVRLRDAVPVTGGLLFDLLDDGKGRQRRAKRRPGGRRNRPGN